MKTEIYLILTATKEHKEFYETRLDLTEQMNTNDVLLLANRLNKFYAKMGDAIHATIETYQYKEKIDFDSVEGAIK